MRIYINDFVEDLNYKNVILSIGNVDLDALYRKLEKDRMNHLYRFDACLENGLMFVENCDLQDVDTDFIDDYGNSLLHLIRDEKYVVYSLQYDENVDRYFVETNIH